MGVGLGVLRLLQWWALASLLECSRCSSWYVDVGVIDAPVLRATSRVQGNCSRVWSSPVVARSSSSAPVDGLRLRGGRAQYPAPIHTHTVRALVYLATPPRIPSSRSTWAHLLDITPALLRSNVLERVELGNGCSSFDQTPRMRRALERRVLEGSNTGGELLVSWC